MTLMRRLDPFAEMVPLREAIDRIFEESFLRPTEWLTRWEHHELAMDVYETPEKLVVEVAVPGIRPEDVDVKIDGQLLAITAEFKTAEEKKEKEYHRRELRYGKFERSFTLPERYLAGKAEAIFENGMLTVTIPKAEQAPAKHVKVQQRAGEPVKGAIKK